MRGDPVALGHAPQQTVSGEQNSLRMHLCRHEAKAIVRRQTPVPFLDVECLADLGRRQVKRLDLTIIPWTHLWLIYFEEWIVSDGWKGGGKHPGEDDPDEGNRTLRRSLRRMR